MKKKRLKVPTRNKGDILVVKVGNADRPAGPADIADVTKQMTKALKGKNGKLTVVTHHAMEFEVVPAGCITGIVVMGDYKSSEDYK